MYVNFTTALLLMNLSPMKLWAFALKERDKHLSKMATTHSVEKVVTNPSGGLLSKGHPLGATGLAQCYELTHQLRGTADRRQVSGARIALQHNLGLGGACVVTAYERAAS